MYEEEIKKLEEQYENNENTINDICYDMQGRPDYEEEEIYSPNDTINEISMENEKINEKINKLKYLRNKELYKQQYNEKMSNYSAGSLLPDIDLDKDSFVRKEKASIIVKYITDIRTKTPFNVGIFAKWGQGKTTFLNYIKEELDKINNEQKLNDEIYKTYVVDYDASEYEEKDKIWASIMKSMFLEYEKKMWFPKLFFNLKKIQSNIKVYITYLMSYIISLVSVGLLSSYAIYTLLNNWKGEVDNEFHILCGAGATIASMIILISKLVIPIGKQLLQSAVPLSEKIINNISLPNYFNKLGERENVKRDLSILVKAWINRGKKKKERIVLIVDELDRCSEKGIIEFFQSMQLLIKVQNIIIIFAIDQEYLKRSLNDYFGLKDEEDEEEFLLNYLDKYINMSICLETNVDYANYIDYLLSIVSRSETQFTISNGEKQRLISTVKVIPKQFLSPRKIKKVINILTISKETCVLFNIKNKEKNIIDFRDYIVWFLFSYFYKKCYIQILNSTIGYNVYSNIEQVLNKMPNSKNLIKDLNNNDFIELLKPITLKDIKSYEEILRGFTKIL